MKIVFMGTPEFAVPSLAKLMEKFEVVAVVSIPDKPAGRGQKMMPSPITQFAIENHIPVLQPTKLKDPVFVNALIDLNAAIFVVVAFRMLPEVVWKIPSLGTINLHGSLLPNYRGAAPINWAIINGETVSGLTTFFIEEKIDTGKILLQYKTDIPTNWNAGDLHDHLMMKGGDLLVETIENIQNNTLIPTEQQFNSTIPLAPKIFKETCKLDFTQSKVQVRNWIRGLSPYPTAWTTIKEGKILKIFEADFIEIEAVADIGVLINYNNKLVVKCSDGWLELKIVQLEGRKKLTAIEFLRGFQL